MNLKEVIRFWSPIALVAAGVLGLYSVLSPGVQPYNAEILIGFVIPVGFGVGLLSWATQNSRLRS